MPVAMKTIAFEAQISCLLEDYRSHLTNAAGLAPATCKCWIFYARQFLCAQFKPRGKGLACSALNARSLLDYFCAQSQHYPPARLQAMGSALRSLCRFLCLSGRHPDDLSAAVPRVADPGREDLPDYLSLEELRRLLAAVDSTTPAGRRERAVLLCLAGLGLRAGEVAQLSLEDLHWEEGTLHLARTKGRRERCLPLPQDVGQAVAGYLRHRPAGTASRRVFLRLRDARPLSASAVSALTVKVCQRAGLTRVRPGAHLLRRTVASHLVQQGASLKAVADLLGHRSLDTTQVYAKVNLAMLGAVTLPWPGSEGCS